MKTKKLKVYGTTLILYGLPKHLIADNGNTQKRVVVATTSWKRAAEHFGTTVGQIRPWASITGNAEEIAICTASPEMPYYKTNDRSDGEYVPLTKKNL